MLWSGRADLAEPGLRAVLAREPGNLDAAQSLEAARRELRPALGLRLAHSADNQDFARSEAWLTWRQWGPGQRWRLEGAVLEDRPRAPGFAANREALQVALAAPARRLAPRVEGALYDGALFGSLQIEPVARHLRLRAGRVNWGRMAFTAAALADRLTAQTLGLAAEARPVLGALRLRVDLYRVSDGNRIYEAEAQATPAWQPLPWGLEWFGGLFSRGAQREDPRYWSPRPAYRLAFAGVRRGWYSERNDISAWLRAGAGLSESAGTSWSAGVSARRWLTRSLSLALEAWGVEAPRPTPYRVYEIGASLQSLW